MEDFIINTTKEEFDPELETDMLSICKLVFSKLNIQNPIFNIVLVDNKTIKELNKDYRGIDLETDVISFAFEDFQDITYENFRFLGEIYISLEKARKQSIEYGHSYRREVCYLTTHGLLHLLGYDHMEESDKKIMRSLEEEILNEYDVKR